MEKDTNFQNISISLSGLFKESQKGNCKGVYYILSNIRNKNKYKIFNINKSIFSNKCTCLHIACVNANTEKNDKKDYITLIKLLVNNGADWSVKNVAYNTPLDWLFTFNKNEESEKIKVFKELFKQRIIKSSDIENYMENGKNQDLKNKLKKLSEFKNESDREIVQKVAEALIKLHSGKEGGIRKIEKRKIEKCQSEKQLRKMKVSFILN